MELVSLLDTHRVRLEDVLSLPRPCKSHDDAKGILAEELVAKWLENTPGVTFEKFPAQGSEFYFAKPDKRRHNVIAYKEKQAIFEFDIFARYNDKLLLVEVKSGKHGHSYTRAQRAISIAQDLYPGADAMYFTIGPKRPRHVHHERPPQHLHFGYSASDVATWAEMLRRAS